MIFSQAPSSAFLPPFRGRFSTSEAGLTLVELVVVATLVAILSTILYGVLSGIIRARDETDRIRDAETTAHYLFTRMTRELSSTSRSLTPLSQLPSAGVTSNNNSGGGQKSGIVLYLEGINSQNGEYARDSIRFVSSNAAQPFVDGPANYGTVEVRYALQDASETEAEQIGMEALPSGMRGKTSILVREELPAAVTNQDTQKKRRIILPIGNNIVSLNFRYFSDGKWKNEWKSISPPLPEAVEVSLGLLQTDGSVSYYRTALPMLPRLRSRKAANSASGQ